MNIEKTWKAATVAWDATWAFVVDYGQPMLVGAGAVGALLAVILVAKFLKTGEVHEKLGKVAVGLATGFAMEGMFEVAHNALKLNVAGALIFCATFEIVMLHQGSLAAHKLAQYAKDEREAAEKGPEPDISRHMRFVWIVSVASAVVSSTASSNLTEVVLRLATPPLAAAIWYMSLYADKEVQRQPTSWIWTPRRIGIHYGLVQPGAGEDLDEVFRKRRVERMVRTASLLRAAKSDSRKGRRLARQLQRMAEMADEEMVLAVAERHQRGAQIQQTIFGEALVVADDASVTHQVTHHDASVTRQEVTRDDAPATRQDDVVTRVGDASRGDASDRDASSRDASVDDAPDADAVDVDASRVDVPLTREEALARAVARVTQDGLTARAAALEVSLDPQAVQRRVRAVRAARPINGTKPELVGTP